MCETSPLRLVLTSSDQHPITFNHHKIDPVGDLLPGASELKDVPVIPFHVL